MRENLQQTIPLGPFLVRQFVFLLPLFTLVLTLKATHGGSIAPLFNELRAAYPQLTEYMLWVSDAGNPFFYLVYAVLLVWALAKRDTDRLSFVAAYVLVQLTVTFLTVSLMKCTFGRPRPYTQATEWNFFTDKSQYHSLPSGHTAEICAAVGPFAHRAKSLLMTLLWGLIPAAMGFTRLFLGKHHPADILVGAGVATLSCYCILALAARLRTTQVLTRPFRRWGWG